MVAVVTDLKPQEFVGFGKERDRQIIDLVTEKGPFSRDQIQALMFPKHKSSQKCNQRLYKLAQAGKLKRIRFGSDEQYIYFTGRWNQKSEHTVMLNWVYVSILSQIKSWLKLQTFSREYTLTWEDGRIISDALVVLKNAANGSFKVAFIEVDRSENSSPFEKVKQYTEYYKSNEWTKQWWAKKDHEGYFNFPKVLIVTDRPQRALNAIERDNKEKLRFKVITLEQVKQDVYAHI